MASIQRKRRPWSTAGEARGSNRGRRLFYIVSGAAVDAMLPLEINPQPSEVKRVFVGRLEIATPKTLEEVRSALETGNRQKVAQYGRFLQPIARRLLSGVTRFERMAFEQRIQSAYAPWLTDPTACATATN